MTVIFWLGGSIAVTLTAAVVLFIWVTRDSKHDPAHKAPRHFHPEDAAALEVHHDRRGDWPHDHAALLARIENLPGPNELAGNWEPDYAAVLGRRVYATLAIATAPDETCVDYTLNDDALDAWDNGDAKDDFAGTGSGEAWARELFAGNPAVIADAANATALCAGLVDA